jgi:hypothetical protein
LYFFPETKEATSSEWAEGEVFGAFEEDEFDAGNRQRGLEVIELIMKWPDLWSHRGDLFELILGCPTKECFGEG